MAERRMFAKTIIDSDAFLEMPQSTQLLYFHLSMRADDDGFVNNPKSIMRATGCKDDDIKVLVAKKFIIPFEIGVVVIKHWRVNNYIQKDRYNETKYKELLEQLYLDENNSYSLNPGNTSNRKQNDIERPTSRAREKRIEERKKSTLPYSFDYKIRNAFIGMECPVCHKTMVNNEYSDNLMPSIQHNKPISLGGKHEIGNISVVCRSCNSSIQNKETGKLNADIVEKIWNEIGNVSGMDTQVRLGKDSIDKDNIYTPKNFSPPTVEEVQAYCKERNNHVNSRRFVDFYSSKGWMIGKNKMKDWRAAVRTWEQNSRGDHGPELATEDIIVPTF